MAYIPSYALLGFDALALAVIALSVQRNSNLKEVAVSQS
jgi:hypothetical protein